MRGAQQVRPPKPLFGGVDPRRQHRQQRRFRRIEVSVDTDLIDRIPPRDLHDLVDPEGPSFDERPHRAPPRAVVRAEERNVGRLFLGPAMAGVKHIRRQDLSQPRPRRDGEDGPDERAVDGRRRVRGEIRGGQGIRKHALGRRWWDGAGAGPGWVGTDTILHGNGNPPESS